MLLQQVLHDAHGAFGVVVVVGSVEARGRDGVDVVGEVDQRMADGAAVCCGSAAEDVGEDFDLDAPFLFGGVGAGGGDVVEWVGELVDDEDVESGRVGGVGEDVDAVGDEWAGEAF